MRCTQKTPNLGKKRGLFILFSVVTSFLPLSTTTPLCSSSTGSETCGVPVAYGPNLNAANHGIGLSNFKGTLDSLLNVTPLEYRLYKQGKIGWNTDKTFLVDSGLTSPTSRACFDDNYFCAPGPCAVLDINYLYDIQSKGIGFVTKNEDPTIVHGKSFCGPVFGTQMLYTANDTVFPTSKANKLALSKLPSPLPSKVQDYIPSNDVVNDIPAWWYESFDDWISGDKRKLRKNGKPCMQRIVPEWLIPYDSSNRGSTKDFEDEDVSNQETTMYDVDNQTSQNAQANYGSQQDLPKPKSGGPLYPYYTLCDSDFLKGVFLGYSAEKHSELGPDKEYSGLTYSLNQLRSIPDPDVAAQGTPVRTIIQAVKYYFETYQKNGKFCQGQSGSTCNFPQFLYEHYQLVHSTFNVCGNNSGVANYTANNACNVTFNSTVEERNTASLAMMVGQLFTVVRPCESFRSRQGKLMSATYNHWRRAHFNPGNNRAAFEHELGCNPAMSAANNNPCRSVRKEIEWETPSACVPLGGCSTVGYDCCTASGSPALTQDARSDTKAAEFMPYAYTTQEESKQSQCYAELGNEANTVTDGFKPGVSVGGASWPYSANKKGHVNRLNVYKPFVCGIKMEKQPVRWCKTKNSGKYITEDTTRFYAVPLCAALGGSSNYFKLFNTFAIERHIDTVEESIFAFAYEPRSRLLSESKVTRACRNYNVLSAFFSFLVNCIVHVESSRGSAAAPTSTQLITNLEADGNGTATEGQQMCGIMALNFKTTSGLHKRVYKTCASQESAWNPTSEAFTPSDSTSGLSWATVVFRAVHRVRKRYLSGTPFRSPTDSVSDTTFVGLEPRGWVWDRKGSQVASIHKFLGGKCTAGQGRCSIIRHPPDLKIPGMSNGARFMQNGYIGQGTGPSANVASDYCKGRYTTAVFQSIMMAAHSYKLYDSDYGQMNTMDKAYDGNRPKFGISTYTRELHANSSCGWSLEYQAPLKKGLFVPGASTTIQSPYEKGATYSVNDGGYWQFVQIEALDTISPHNLPVYEFKNAQVVHGNPYAFSHVDPAPAIQLCTEYRYLNCVGVQQVPASPTTFSYYLISLENLLRGKSTFRGNHSGYKFYPVPCYTLETTADIFGCNASPTRRNVSVRQNLSPMGVPMWSPTIPMYAGMQESYLLDGLGHYTSNARFTLNKSSFIENKLGIGMDSAHDKANGISMDFDMTFWQETRENVDRGQQIHLPAFQGLGGLAVNHLDGIKHVPVQTSGILTDFKKTQLFSWAGMFDTDGWILERKYRFQHPSHKYSDQFLYYPPHNSSGIDVTVHFVNDNAENVTFKINDVFVRAMLYEPLDLSNATHKSQWTNLFFNRIRNIASAFELNEASRISTISCGRGYVILGPKFEPECLPNMSDADVSKEFASYLDPLNFPEGVTWKNFADKYEYICDLHACDVMSNIPAGFKSSTVYQDGSTSAQQGFSCVPKGYSYFQRGMSPVDAELKQTDDVTSFTNTEINIGTHIQSAFGFMGHALTSIEASILRDVILSRYQLQSAPQPSVSLQETWKNAVDQSKFQKDLWFACSRVAANNGAIMDSVVTCVDVLKAQAARGYPDTIVQSSWSNANEPPKNVARDSESILSRYTADASRHEWDEVDYAALDTSDLYTEHREAIPVGNIDRSASYNNLEQANNAVPCDCDNQPIVWVCNRIVSEGTNSPFANRYNFSADVPQSAFWSTADDYGNTIQLVECGYSWKSPPKRTPKIGLYVPSKIDLFEMYERDIFSGYQHAPVNGSCLNLPNGSLGPDCARDLRLDALLKACATEMFSIPMAPRADKLKTLLFTGKHPVVSGLAAENNARALYDDGFITEDEYKEIASAQESAGTSGSPVCWQKQELTVFDSPCLRYPFGVQHSSTLGSNDEATAGYLNTIYSAANYGNFSEGSRRKYYNAHRIKTIGWQGYCELETTAENLQDDWSVFDSSALKFRYCQNDPMTLTNRETLCSSIAPHFVMYAWALTDRQVKNACNYNAKLCIIIPGYASSGLLSSVMSNPDLPDVNDFTFLVMPIHYDIISEYFARRNLFEVGNSFGRSLDAHLHDVTDADRAKYKPKHPLDLKPRETVRFADADIQLNDSDASFTGIGVDVDAFSVLAKIPDTLTVDAAMQLMNTVVAQINSTCRIRPLDSTIPRDRWKQCKSDSDRQSGVFLLPHLNVPLEADHLRELPIDEVYRPYPPDRIVVDTPRVTIKSAVKTMPLRFSPNPYVNKVSKGITCTYIFVGAQEFELHNAEFNQTLCSHLNPSDQVPIIMSGVDVSDAYIELRLIVEHKENGTVSSAMSFLGNDNRVFESSSTLAAKNIKVIATAIKVDSNNEQIPWDDSYDMFFHAALAKVTGDFNFMPYRNGEPSVAVRTVLVQEMQGRNGNVITPRLFCKNNLCEPNKRSIYSCGNQNQTYSTDLCRILNVTSATGVFGSQYESQIFHKLADKTHVYVAFAVVLSIFAAAVFFLNVGLLYVGNSVVHRMIGLHPPLSHEDIELHFKHKIERSTKTSKKHVPTQLLGPGQWKTVHPDAQNRHLLDFGYGVVIHTASGAQYSVEKIARDVRRGYPFPLELTQEYPQFVERVLEYNRKIQ